MKMRNTSVTNRNMFLLNSISSLFSNAVSIVVGILIVPIALGYWHEEKYGVWILITTLVSYLSLSNLGLNSAATTLISKSKYSQHKIIILKKSFLIILIYLILLLVIILIFFKENNWDFIFGNISLNIKVQAYRACSIMLIFAIPNIALSLSSSALIGFQKAYIDNIILAIIPLANMLALLIIISRHDNLIGFAILSGSLTLIVNSMKAIVFLLLYRKWLGNEKFEIDNQSKDIKYREIIIIGLRFFIMNIAVMVSWNTDNIVLSRIMGVRFVTAYAITFKLFSIAFSLMGIISAAINPIFAKEFGMNNWTWINETYKKIIDILTFISGGICIGGILLSREIITVWAGKDSYAGLTIVVVLGIYTYFLSINTVDANIINTFNYTKNISWIYILSSTVKLLVSIISVKYLGVVGVAIGTLVSSVFITSWIFPFWIKIKSKGNLHSQNTNIITGMVILIPFIIVSIIVSIYVQFGSLSKILVSMLILVAYCAVKLRIIINVNSDYIIKIKSLKKYLSRHL